MASTFHILLSLQQDTITRTTQKKTQQNNKLLLYKTMQTNSSEMTTKTQCRLQMVYNQNTLNLNKVDPFLNTSPTLTSFFEPPLNYKSNHTSNSVNNSPKKKKKKVSNNFQCKCIKNKIIIPLV
jgi:hypothetical protein